VNYREFLKLKTGGRKIREAGKAGKILPKGKTSIANYYFPKKHQL
jgi:hypothetical protein